VTGPPPLYHPRPRVAWGLPDALIAWLFGLLAAVIGTVIAISVLAATSGVPNNANDYPVWVLLVTLATQEAATVGWLWWASLHKGLGTLAADFGLRVRAVDWRWFFAGMGLGLLTIVLLAPIAHFQKETQGVVRQFEHASAIEVPLYVLGVGVVAPVVEELLFRGVLLRALARRTTIAWAVFGSALAFAIVHPLLDFSAIAGVPAFFALGIVSGYQAARTGNLSRSILLHIGFNAFTLTLLLLAS
jgi:membrane protease YdiL (CAAX protease family)